MPNLLEVDSVVKSFDLKPLITDIYIRCLQGDIIGIFGRNGIGKSTLLKIIYGTLSAENKHIRINSELIEKPYLSKDTINYLPQSGFIPSNLTVEQAVGFYFKKKEKDVFWEDEILSKVLKTKIAQLSSGEGRYLEIKMLLKTKSKFLLLDEPYNGASPLVIESIKKLIQNESFHKGIILTDHDYNNVISVANKLLLMYDGGLREIKNKQELIDLGYLVK